SGHPGASDSSCTLDSRLRGNDMEEGRCGGGYEKPGMPEASMQRERMEYDVVVVGAGPSGLAAAIRLEQLAGAGGGEIAGCVIEKGSEVGAHILSGAVFEPRALDELIPDWRECVGPANPPARHD